MSITNKAGQVAHSNFCCTKLLGRTWLVLVAAFVAQAACAAPHPPLETLSAKVFLADLDLNTPAGVAAARERIASTANRLCSKLDDSRKADHAEAREECFQQSLAASLEQLRAHVRFLLSRP